MSSLLNGYATCLRPFPFQIFRFMTNKNNQDVRNGIITCDFFHCEAMISSLAKVMDLQSHTKKRVIFIKLRIK